MNSGGDIKVCMRNRMKCKIEALIRAARTRTCALGCLILLIAALCVSGCSTIDTQSMLHEGPEFGTICEISAEMDSPIAYSGTWHDVHDIIFNPVTCNTEDCLSMSMYPVMLVFGIVDLGFSFTADTLIFPYTGYRQFVTCKKRSRDRR